jgi:type VI secretion system protein ImpE
MSQAEELLREGKIEEALAKLQDQVRNDPAKPELRMFLFQLLSVVGNWPRALTQLNVAAELDGEKMLIAAICRPALESEAFRSAVFEGKKTPLVLGEPEQWVSLMIQANELLASGELLAAAKLREQAFDAAPAVSGKINGHDFAWLADADTRLGPILEAIIDYKYFWIPLTRVKAVRVEEPKALRNIVWAEAQFTWTNGGQAPGLIPTRYAGSELSSDSALRLGRQTSWKELDGGHFVGLGQRMLATDRGEYPLLDIRSIILDNEMTTAAGEQAGQGQETPEREPADG